MLLNADYCHLVEAIGRASLGASDRTIWHLTKVYWYTVEFGVVREGADVKAFGAGILSRCVLHGSVAWLCRVAVLHGCLAWLCGMAVRHGCAAWLCWHTSAASLSGLGHWHLRLQRDTPWWGRPLWGGRSKAHCPLASALPRSS